MKYTVFNSCHACLNQNSVFFISKTAFNRNYQYTKTITYTFIHKVVAVHFLGKWGGGGQGAYPQSNQILVITKPK